MDANIADRLVNGNDRAANDWFSIIAYFFLFSSVVHSSNVLLRLIVY